MVPNETLFAQAQSMPINYKEKVLSVRWAGSSGRTLCYSKTRLLEILTWRAEAGSNTDLESEEQVILLVTKTLLNLGNSLKSLGFPFSKIVKPHIALVGFQGVEPRELFGSMRSHLLLHEQDVEPDYVSPSIGRHLEHRQPVEAKDVPEVLAQQKLYPKFEEHFRGHNLSPGSLVCFAQFLGITISML